MSTSGLSKIYNGAHVVTRPNPDVVGINNDQPVNSSAELLLRASEAWTIESDDGSVQTNKQIGPESRRVLFQSFKDMDDENNATLVPYGNGFVDGIIRAFQQDLHLVLRPDDMWLAIMVQFSSYINGHAEEMRHFFVTHKGKKQLFVDMRPYSLANIDFQQVARLFTSLIQKNVIDPDLEAWMLPKFSTTTDGDVGVAAMVMMATTKAYFEYVMCGGCGFPSVTLLGERADWVCLLHKVEKFATYGEELADWGKLLTKVAEKMIKTFDQPNLQSTKDFWMSAVHQEGSDGSGTTESLSGWITAFCYWNAEGGKFYPCERKLRDRFGWETDRKRLVIDGVAFPIISAKSIPRAVAEVPVMVLDYKDEVCYKTTVIAGFVGVESTANEEGKPHDTVQPRSGYWMLVDKAGPMPKNLSVLKRM
jgi:hypothetical protein